MTRLRGEQGITVVELLVVIALLGISMPMILGTLVNVSRTVKANEQRLADLDEVRGAMRAMTRDVRTAVRIPHPPALLRSAAPDDLWFHANVNPSLTGGPYLVRYFVRDGQLIQQRTPPAPSGDGWVYPTGTVERVLVRHLADLTPFSYSCGAVPCTDPVDPEQVRTVDIALGALDPSSRGRPPVVAASRVRLINNLLDPAAGSSP